MRTIFAFLIARPRQGDPFYRYLKQAGFVAATRRGHFVITERGRAALANTGIRIDNQLLRQFEEFQAFQGRSAERAGEAGAALQADPPAVTPDEALRAAHRRIEASLAADLIDRVRSASPAFFETLGHSNVILTASGGAFGHKDGPKQGATSCRQGQETWKLRKAGAYGSVSLSDGVIKCAKTHERRPDRPGLERDARLHG